MNSSCWTVASAPLEGWKIPDVDCHKIEYLPVSESSKIFSENVTESCKMRFNEDRPLSEQTPARTIHQQFADIVAKFGNHQAFGFNSSVDAPFQFVNFRQYYSLATVVAKAFIELGLEEFKGVAILGFNSLEWFAANMGAVFARGVTAGIYTTNNTEACLHALKMSKANILVVDSVRQLEKVLPVWNQLPLLKHIIVYRENLPENCDERVLSWDAMLEIGLAANDDKLVERLKVQRPNDTAILLFTSGTTGNAKAVMLTHDNMTWMAKQCFDRFNLSTGHESYISFLPLSHSAAQITDIYGHIYGANCNFFAQPDALRGTLNKTLVAVRPTLFLAVPRVYEKIQEGFMAKSKELSGIKKRLSNWARGVGLRGAYAHINREGMPWGFSLANSLVLNKVKALIGLDRVIITLTGAAPISKETLDFFMSLNLPLMECYGMTESSAPHTISDPERIRIGSVGKPPSVDCKIKIDKPDESGVGEICMYGRNVFMGYADEPEKTKECVDDEGYLHSGDLGKIDADGFLHITGRIKELIITAGGENIAPVLIEDNIKAALPCVSQAMVVGDQKKFLSVLLSLKCDINLETMEPMDSLSPITLSWLEDLGLKNKDQFKSMSDILEGNSDDHKLINKAIENGIKAANAKAVSRASNVQKYTIIPKDLSIPGGELGPTLKIKRPVVLNIYTEQVAEMYAE